MSGFEKAFLILERLKVAYSVEKLGAKEADFRWIF
jgi:hypothetical protein